MLCSVELSIKKEPDLHMEIKWCLMNCKIVAMAVIEDTK